MTIRMTGYDQIEEHLLARLKHSCHRTIRRAFCELHILYEHEMNVEGFPITRFDVKKEILVRDEGDPFAIRLTGNPVHDLRLLKTLFGAGFNCSVQQTEKVFGSCLARTPQSSDTALLRVDRTYVLQLLRCFNRQLDIIDVVVARLLARALNRSGLSAIKLREQLAMPASLIILRSDIEGFDEVLIRMLYEERLYRGCVHVREIDDWNAVSGHQHHRKGGHQAHFVINTFNAASLSALSNRSDDLVSDALARGETILGIVGMTVEIPPDLLAAADIITDIGSLDAGFLNTLLDTIEPPDRDTIIPHDFFVHSLKALRLSFREGRSRQQMFDQLVKQQIADGEIATRRAKKKRAEEAVSASKKKKPWDKDSPHSERGRHGKVIESSSILIEPEPLEETTDLKRLNGYPADGTVDGIIDDAEFFENRVIRKSLPLRVETLSGYGEAVDWALALKEDIALWHTGMLDWSALSTKLLLAGPSGTGKTTFVKALCNSLQIPVLATSVAAWLQMGHLGDVLLRMKSAFEEATSHAPSILFIDEIDGIGRRQDTSREYADYWNSVVNQFLELVDGVVKREGIIIVGATNRPDDIDEAITRSGRLETHIRISRPDTDALIGILAHHIGSDLETVLATQQDKPQ